MFGEHTISPSGGGLAGWPLIRALGPIDTKKRKNLQYLKSLTVASQLIEPSTKVNIYIFFVFLFVGTGS